MTPPRCGFAAPPWGGDAGGPAEPDPRRLLEEGRLGASSGGRDAPLAIDAAQFGALGRALVDRIAAWQAASAQRRPEALGAQRSGLDLAAPLPVTGTEVEALLDDAARRLLDASPPGHHPRLHGYISAAPAPVGVLAELLAAAVNVNVALWHAAPVASDIEAQTVRWLAELVGYLDPRGSPVGGLLTSGGTQANAMALQLALTARIDGFREQGLRGAPVAVYASDQTHGWLGRAVEQAGLGRQAVRWIASDAQQRIDLAALGARIAADIAAGVQPVMAVGTAGTVGTGAVDPLRAMATLCRRHGLWFHVDGAYGAAAACLVGSSREALLGDAAEGLAALGEADSLTLDPHKWLYAPLEAGCLLVRDAQRLPDAYAEPLAEQPDYYAAPLAGEGPSYHRLGPQNSRGFRALKVWLALRMAGRDGYRQMIGDDIALARRLFEQVSAHPRLEALTQRLSVTTFRYVPAAREPADAASIDRANAALLDALRRDGPLPVSPARVGGRFALRACVVNFQTTQADIDALPGRIVALGDRQAG